MSKQKKATTADTNTAAPVVPLARVVGFGRPVTRRPAVTVARCAGCPSFRVAA